MTDPQRLPPDLPVPPDDGACRHLPDCECPPWRCPELATAQSISVVRRQPGPCSIASRARASRASRLRRTGTGSPAHEAAPRKPAISATIISAWPRSAPSCSGSAPRPEPRCRNGDQAASALRAAQRRRLPADRGAAPADVRGGRPADCSGARPWSCGTRVIEAVFYPIFPPDRSTVPLIEWLANRQTG